MVHCLQRELGFASPPRKEGLSICGYLYLVASLVKEEGTTHTRETLRRDEDEVAVGLLVDDVRECRVRSGCVWQSDNEERVRCILCYLRVMRIGCHFVHLLWLVRRLVYRSTNI